MTAARALVFVAFLLLAGCAAPQAPSAPGAPAATTPAVTDEPTMPTGQDCARDAVEPCASWDLAANGTPRFVRALHLDLDLVGRVSRFRSGFGHDFTQQTNETCRSLKHYFVPRDLRIDPATWEIRSPVDGRIVRAEAERTFGAQVWIAPDERPEFRVIVFHVALDPTSAVGADVRAGERIGHHASNGTANDVAVLALTPEGRRLVSYVDVMRDDAFAPFAARGLARADLVIEQAWRDAHPMACDAQGNFVGGDTSRDWVVLDG